MYTIRVYESTGGLNWRLVDTLTAVNAAEAARQAADIEAAGYSTTVVEWPAVVAK
jgi:hypothetical protein